MPKGSGKKKRRRDVNQLAQVVVDEAPDEPEDSPPADEGENPAAVALGRLGGKKGGKARAEKLTRSGMACNTPSCQKWANVADASVRRYGLVMLR